jgi:cation transport ATPase
MSLRLSRRQRFAIDTALALVALSGVAWLLLERPDALDPAPRAWLRQDVRLHAFAGLAVVYAAGMLWLVHIRRAWRSHRNRVAGVTTLVLLAWLVLTGYALGYFTDDATHVLVARAHWIAGLAAIAIYVTHRLRGAQTRTGSRSR